MCASCLQLPIKCRLDKKTPRKGTFPRERIYVGSAKCGVPSFHSELWAVQYQRDSQRKYVVFVCVWYWLLAKKLQKQVDMDFTNFCYRP